MKVNNLYIQDTIVASASAAGIGGINIIRLSGVHTEKIIKIILGKNAVESKGVKSNYFVEDLINLNWIE